MGSGTGAEMGWRLGWTWVGVLGDLGYFIWFRRDRDEIEIEVVGRREFFIYWCFGYS